MEETKIVDFEYYCRYCVNFKKKEEEEPCCDCLEVPARYNSKKPERFEPTEKYERDHSGKRTRKDRKKDAT
ncbi:MAG: hypothetical protein KBT27_09300 [Prevotellaceae bacterium]|nr:hypothetical protein [Candidatus Faecinaster equi]